MPRLVARRGRPERRGHRLCDRAAVGPQPRVPAALFRGQARQAEHGLRETPVANTEASAACQTRHRGGCFGDRVSRLLGDRTSRPGLYAAPASWRHTSPNSRRKFSPRILRASTCEYPRANSASAKLTYSSGPFKPVR